MRKIVLVHTFFVLITLPFFYVDSNGSNLVWDMFLAILALDLAFMSYYYRQKNRLISLLTGVAWLFFYPNSFKILADLISFQWEIDALGDHVVLISFAIVISSLLLAVMSGALSVRVMLASMAIKTLPVRYSVIICLSFFSSFAIYIDRYARLNVWDAVLNLQQVFHQFLVTINQSAMLFILMFTFFQLVVLLLLDGKDV